MTLSKGQFGNLYGQMMAAPGVEGGFTVHAVTGEQPSSGIMVSLPNTETYTAPASATKPSSLPRYVRQHRESLSKPDVYLGGWKPKTDEYTTIDRSQRFAANPAIAQEYGQGVAEHDALERGLTMGYSRHQDAVFNLKTKRTTPTGYERGESQ